MIFLKKFDIIYIENKKGRKNMRPEDRIDRICELLRKAWHQVPDWRLCQLINNLLGDDIYYIEDTITEARLSQFYNGSKK